MQIQKIKRVFKYKKNGKDIILPDPNPDFSGLEVVKFYGSQHPEITNGFVEGPKIEKDEAVFTISTKAGQLG